jgi:hypothetical protein
MVTIQGYDSKVLSLVNLTPDPKQLQVHTFRFRDHLQKVGFRQLQSFLFNADIKQLNWLEFSQSSCLTKKLAGTALTQDF